MKKIEDLTGMKFGRLTVLKQLDSTGQHIMYLCACDCGNEKTIRATNLYRDKTKSCGCIQIEIVKRNCKKHGFSNTKLYIIWNAMIRRCSNEDYKYYARKGITVCDEWKNDFMSFYNWSMDNGYLEGLSIDRINNNGNYEPSNCKFSTMKEQGNNKSNNIVIEYDGIKMTLPQWCVKYNMKQNVMRKRIERGWNFEKIINTPVQVRR